MADGYGESLVHRYSADGRYLSSLSGEEGPAGRFNCPHGVFIDRRPATPEVWVADRGNARVQVYDTEGHWLRTVGEGFLNSPSAFATDGSNIVVGELFARLAVVDTDDRLVGYLGEDDEAREHPGWPNGLGPTSTRSATRTCSLAISTARTASRQIATAIYTWPSG